MSWRDVNPWFEDNYYDSGSAHGADQGRYPVNKSREPAAASSMSVHSDSTYSTSAGNTTYDSSLPSFGELVSLIVNMIAARMPSVNTVQMLVGLTQVCVNVAILLFIYARSDLIQSLTS